MWSRIAAVNGLFRPSPSNATEPPFAAKAISVSATSRFNRSEAWACFDRERHERFMVLRKGLSRRGHFENNKP